MYVLKRMSENTLQLIITYILERNLQLWVLKKSDQFVHDSILLALYKDLFAFGLQEAFWLRQKVAQLFWSLS